MNERAAFATDTGWLEERLGLLALRLSIEVTRLRALRADGRTEAFAGVLMRDADIAALCAELTGQGLPDLAQAEAALAQAGQRHAARLAALPVAPPLARLAALYALSPVEEALAVLALAPALDPRFGRVYGFLHEDMAQQHLTLGLAQRLIAGAAGGGLDSLRAALAPQAPLLRHGLLRLAGEAALVARRIEMPEGILRLLLPEVALPEGVTALPLPGAPGRHGLPRLIITDRGGDPVIGGGFAGPLWIAPRDRLSVQAAREAGVAAAISGVGIAYAGWDAAPPDDRRALASSLGRHGAVFTHRPALWEGLGVPWHALVCLPPPHGDRLAFWAALTATLETDAAPALAAVMARDRLHGAPTLWPLACEAAADADPPARLAAMLRHRSAEPMQGLAERVATPHDVDDLCLPEPAKARLRGFAGRRLSALRVLEDWGLGAVLGGSTGGIALFTGPPGVGKTMAAGVVARLAGLDLWRINLATVVSKYIGETEANLERIFSAAGEAEVVLFFDEAEALFSKRGEVKDARDRYANMEMSYLLQRLETFPGMAVLASNMGTTLDPALLRRFDLVMEFSLPGAAARRAIWARIELGAVPLAADVDLDLLAERFDLAGGHIKQAILAAAHEAAQAGSAVAQAHLLQAVAREYAKLGRSLRREDFGAAFAQVRGG